MSQAVFFPLLPLVLQVFKMLCFWEMHKQMIAIRDTSHDTADTVVSIPKTNHRAFSFFLQHLHELPFCMRVSEMIDLLVWVCFVNVHCKNDFSCVCRLMPRSVHVVEVSPNAHSFWRLRGIRVWTWFCLFLISTQSDSKSGAKCTNIISLWPLKIESLLIIFCLVFCQLCVHDKCLWKGTQKQKISVVYHCMSMNAIKTKKKKRRTFVCCWYWLRLPWLLMRNWLQCTWFIYFQICHNIKIVVRMRALMAI